MKKLFTLSLLILLAFGLQAQSKNIAYQDETVRFTVITDGVIRMEYAKDGHFVDEASQVAVIRDYPTVDFKVKEGTTIEITTSKLRLHYKKGSGAFTAENLSISSLKGVNPSFVWKPGMVQENNLKGTYRTLDSYEGDTRVGTTDKKIPLEDGLLATDGWTLIDDSKSYLFDNSDWPWVMERESLDNQDWYFMGYGHDYKQALKAARQCDSRQWTVQTLNNIAMTFDMLGQKDSLRYYTQQAQPYYEDTHGAVRATYLVNCASYMLSMGQCQEAKRCLIESRLISPTNRGEKLLADIYMAEGDTAAAIQQWYRLSGSLSPDVAIQSYRQLITYMNLQGDLRGVAEFSQRLNEVYHRLYEHNDAAAVIDLQAQFDEQLKERRQFRSVIVLLAAIILVIVLSALIIWYNRRRIDLLNARFAESQMQYDLTRTELTLMRRTKEREQRENSRQMKDILSRLHTAAGKGKPAPDDDMNALAQLSYAMRPKLRELLSPLSSKEQQVCLLTVHNFLPSEIANLTIATPQAITNTRVRLLRKLFGETGGAKDFDTAIKEYGTDDVIS